MARKQKSLFDTKPRPTAVQKEALKTLRNRTRARPDRGRKGLGQDGIYMVYRSRYEDAAREVADLVREAGGTVDYVKKIGTIGREMTGRPWHVVFTVSVDADNYLTGNWPLKDVTLDPV